MQELTKKIVDAIREAQTSPTECVSLYESPDQLTARNEMLFFIKPELTLPSSDNIQYAKIVDLALNALDRFDFKVRSVDLLGARYLKQARAIASHYGVINRLSMNAMDTLSQSAREAFTTKFGSPVEDARLLGAFEFIEKHPFLSADALDMIWQNVTNTKLAGGTYCASIRFDGQEFSVINGFHPRQLEHFIQPGRSIVTFHVVTDTPWNIARQQFIGATNPAKAEPGSLRQQLLEKKDDLGLSEVSQGCNGVHLSAGPFEALAELCRFQGLDPTQNPDALKRFALGQQILALVPPQQAIAILNDQKMSLGGKSTSVYEATEELDTDAAIECLREGGLIPKV